MNRKVFLIGIIIILSIILLSCNQSKDYSREEDINNFKLKIKELEAEINRLNIINNDLTHELNTSKEGEFRSGISINLLELTLGELEKYNEFKKNYSEEVLYGVDPLTICKMYFYSSYKGDYETEYEFYTNNKETVRWTKEEHMNVPNRDRIRVFDLIENAQDVKVDRYKKKALITWNYDGDNEDGFRYGFSLEKSKTGIWKVCFIPMQ